jgi:hypothetical protein
MRAAAADAEIVVLAKRLSIDPVVVVIGLIARAVANEKPSAARCPRAIFSRRSKREIDRLVQLFCLPWVIYAFSVSGFVRCLRSRARSVLATQGKSVCVKVGTGAQVTHASSCPNDGNLRVEKWRCVSLLFSRAFSLGPTCKARMSHTHSPRVHNETPDRWWEHQACLANGEMSGICQLALGFSPKRAPSPASGRDPVCYHPRSA